MTIGDGVDGRPYISDPIRERIAMAEPTYTRNPDGVDLIAQERRRQIDPEGYSPEHDQHHGNGSLAWAAACYAAPDTVWRVVERDLSDQDGEHHELRYYEPWPRSWRRTVNLTPTTDDRVRELVKAGALIAAEIDRLRNAD